MAQNKLGAFHIAVLVHQRGTTIEPVLFPKTLRQNFGMRVELHILRSVMVKPSHYLPHFLHPSVSPAQIYKEHMLNAKLVT
ncbi:hypothetical protein AKG08_09195 [Achromobacter piechaudii]|nr:hypothetical protein AKG08_09195 [Achromobacter piechaudii]